MSAGGIRWRCDGDTCTASGPWPRPGVAACRALAAEVGPLRSYGRRGAALSADRVRACNRGARKLAGARDRVRERLSSDSAQPGAGSANASSRTAIDSIGAGTGRDDGDAGSGGLAAPAIDTRAHEEALEELRSRIGRTSPEWSEHDRAAGTGPGDAAAGIRFGDAETGRRPSGSAATERRHTGPARVAPARWPGCKPPPR